MQFNSYEFIFLFLPLILLCYYGANQLSLTLGKIVIIVFSLFYYAFGREHMLVYLGISVLINYGFSAMIVRFHTWNKKLLCVPIIINVGLLLYFKYLGFAITNVNRIFGKDIPYQELALPLGISFYTFQQIAYIIALERNELPNNNLIDYLAYILYFPKLIMGPIIEPVDYILQINQKDRKKIRISNIIQGIEFFSLGLLKKVLFADTFARAVSWALLNDEILTAMDCFLLVLFYTFEIYFDFSGYSDMAVGVSTMLNIDLPMNFDSPYKALSIRDFWKRWHISLTRFLSKYIYFPLGGSRKGIVITCVNTLIVFGISGLWHGANWTFVLWGILHGLFSCFDRLFEKYEKRVFIPVRWFCTFCVVGLLWLLFSVQSIDQWKNILLKMLFMQSTEISGELIDAFSIVESQFIYDFLGLNYLPAHIKGFNMWIFIFMASFICFVPENNFRREKKLGISSLLLSSVAFIWGVLCLGTESTFLYYGF